MDAHDARRSGSRALNMARRYRLLIGLTAVLLAVIAVLLWPRPAATSVVPAVPAAEAAVQRNDRPRPAAPREIQAAPAKSGAERVLALRRDVAAGDPVAMRDLAELILRCGFGTSHGAGLWSQVDFLAGHMRTDHVPLLRAAAARRGALCENIPGDRRAQALQYRQLLQDAAKQGDLLARLRQRSRAWDAERETALPDDAAALVEDALISDDPRALYEMAYLYTLRPGAPVQAGIGSSRHDHTALVLLACERGLDCGVGSDYADDICLNSGDCAGGLDSLLWRAAGAEGATKDVQARMQWLRTLLDEVDRAR